MPNASVKTKSIVFVACVFVEEMGDRLHYGLMWC